MTGPLYSGASLTAVCRSEVVAPPIRIGMRSPICSTATITLAISSSDGVISPLSPITSACCRTAVSTIRSLSTITPRSSTRYPLQASTTETMFFPMSCTSPLTVASTMRPADAARPSRRSASM